MNFRLPVKGFNSRLQEILDAQTDPGGGSKVVLVELKHIDLPQEI